MTAAKTIKINRTTAKKVLAIVDAGLSHGLGNPKPGEMCVEAAVCFALGLPHNDDPGCVSPTLRSLKITLNDKAWSSPEARARGLRRLAIAQLGTKDELDDKIFVAAVAEMTIRTFVPIALRAAASINPKHADKLEVAAKRCEKEGTKDAAASAAADAKRDSILAQFAEAVVQILIRLGVKATAFLDLAPYEGE